jgi:tetratricopeptide (TPR) repeat protein
MTKVKFGLVAVLFLAGKSLFAQSVQEARKLLYYERFQSAKDMLQKVVASNPSDAEAVYWLSQAEFGLHNPEGAKASLRKGMEGANSSNPMLLAAMGQAELAEGKVNDARQRFETALSLSKGKDIAVLNAIGKANLEKSGDAAYAVEKLKMATQLMDAQKKGPKDPDVYITMGDAYRKLMDGGNAVTSYQNALTADPKHAAAKYKTGKVYLTQGNEQKDIFLKNFEEAVAMDPAYAPAYYDLYTYYFTRDVYKSTGYFNQYKSNSDTGPALDYEEASLLYASGDFKGAIAKADQLLAAQGDKADARLYRLQAYSYDKLGDSLKTVEKLDAFFKVARPDQIVPDNYVNMAINSAKFPARQAKVDEYFMKAVDADTSLANRIDYTRKAADFFKKAKNQPKAAEWYNRVLSVNPNPGKVDLYNAGFENFRAGEYQRSDSVFKIYAAKYPDEVYGHYWSFRALSVIDSTMEKGLAIADCQKFIEVAEKDKVKNKNTLVTAYGYMAGYHANMKKDFPTAITYLDKILEVDPTNADAAKNKEILQKAGSNKGAAPKTGGTAPPKSMARP